MSEDTWEEPIPLSQALLDYLPRGRGRPKKGDEVVHGVDVEYVAHLDAATEAGLRPLQGQGERTGVRMQKESTRHRVLVYQFAQGGSVRSVFEALGGEWDNDKKCAKSGTGEYSYQQLVNIRRQPWFQNELIAVIAENGSDLVEAKLKIEMMSSLETLIEIRDNAEEKGATRVTAANSLLDRYLGKPTQHVKTESLNTTATHERDAIQLQERLARLRQEAKDINAAVEHTEI